MVKQPTQSGSIIKTVTLALVIGLSLTLGSIIIGEKSAYPECNFREAKLQMVDRGFPLTYFRVTPSDSDCASVEDVGAVFRSDVGNEIKPVPFVLDVAIWSTASGGLIIFIRKLIKSVVGPSVTT
jgi:hypothetical protein